MHRRLSVTLNRASPLPLACIDRGGEGTFRFERECASANVLVEARELPPVSSSLLMGNAKAGERVSDHWRGSTSGSVHFVRRRVQIG